MPAAKLVPHRVVKPWGCHELTPWFAEGGDDGRVGEIWFGPNDATVDLLVKYLFTSERLSIQVHPGDADARAAGLVRGKDEAWIILEAEPGATIALGLKVPISREQLRVGALDGTIETLVDWRPVAAGDVVFSPAGTIHAIGAGIVLIEIQQNVDVTYRIYDYGRPRELHLDAGLAVARPTPIGEDIVAHDLGDGRQILLAGPTFVLERWTGAGERRLMIDRPGVFVPVAGHGTVDGQAWRGGECWAIDGAVDVGLARGADILLAYPGDAIAQQADGTPPARTLSALVT